MGALEGGVHPVFSLQFIAFCKMAVNIASVDREQVVPLIAGFGKPCEMIDSNYIYMDIVPVVRGVAGFCLVDAFKHFLGAKYLVAAAKGLNFREYVVQCLDAQGHGIGVVDDPAVGGIGLNGFCNFHKHGDRAQGADHPAGSGSVADRLVDSQTFRKMDIRVHLIKCAGKNRDHGKIAAGESFLKAVFHLKFPVTPCVLAAHKTIADDCIVFGSAAVNVIKTDGSADLFIQGKISHKGPGPASGTAPDVSDLNVGNFVFAVVHELHPPAKYDTLRLVLRPHATCF